MKTSLNGSGYSLEEIYGWEPCGYARTVHKDDLPLAMKQSRKKQAGDADVITNYQFRGFTISKEIVWWDLHSSTITYHGRPADLFTFVDITERVKSENDRAALEAKPQHSRKEVDSAQGLGAGKYIKKPCTLPKLGLAVKEELEK